MRILDEDKNNTVNRLTLLLCRSEAEELRDSLESILKGEIEGHAHVPSEDYCKEITLALYSPSDFGSFNIRCQKLIREDQ